MIKPNLDRCTLNNMIKCISDELKKMKINLAPEVVDRILVDGIEIEASKKEIIKVNKQNVGKQPEEYDIKILNAIAEKYFQDPFYKNLNEIRNKTYNRLKNIIKKEIKNLNLY